MEAGSLNCPNCGAASSSDATMCEHCGARLATVACPSCFGMIFLGSKFCEHCGAKIERVEEEPDAALKCPRHHGELARVSVGPTLLHECKECAGLWIDNESFKQICADREKQSTFVPTGLPEMPRILMEPKLDDVRYIPCPVCATLMNRINFGHNSGVIVDVCQKDGVWFDRDELRRIVEFIRAGGLEKNREGETKNKNAASRGVGLSGGAVNVGGGELETIFKESVLETVETSFVIVKFFFELLFRSLL